jgi:glucose-6-phosphate isomerase
MLYKDNYHPTISNDELFSDILKEKENIGYYDLVFQDTTMYKEYAKSINQKYVVVIGIGGSTLGTSAIYTFLKDSKKLEKELIFLDTTDPIDIKTKISNIKLDDTLFIVISKSGTTVETIAIFKYLHSLVEISKDNTLIITENDSKLNSFAKQHAIKTFEIPKNVGGRFSVFSAVGLVPLSIIGIDIDKLLSGAKKRYEKFFAKDEYFARLLNKARFFVEYKYHFNINVLFSYSSRLENFNKWYVQLWGESLGKVDVDSTEQGLTPIGLIGPIDQHSFLQLIMEGRKDKTVTFITIKNFNNQVMIPRYTLKELEELDYLNDISFSELINLQAEATIEAVLENNRIPCDVIEIGSICEESIAMLMYEYELLTSICAKFLHINAYDQPGVEAGKIILKKKLKDRN